MAHSKLAVVAMLVALVALVAAGCNHDDEIKDLMNAGDGMTRTPSGSGGDEGTGGDSSTGGNSSGTGGDDGVAADVCFPCDDPPAGEVEFETCCTGTANRFCGLREVGVDDCIRLDVATIESANCPTHEVCNGDACEEAAGCCRPDGHCGVVISGIAGCIAGTEVPEGLGGPFVLRSCVFECEGDEDCGGSGNGFLCSEEAASSRVCARECFSDLHCVSQEVCALRSNKIEDRVESLCQEPIGTGGVGEPCNDSKDCASGTCSGPSGEARHCSRLCQTDDECGGALPRCGDATIAVPSGQSNGSQLFRICK